MSQALNNTKRLIQKSKTRDLIKLHKTLVINHLKKKSVSNAVRVRVLKYYDSIINENNIEDHYPKKIEVFLSDILT